MVRLNHLVQLDPATLPEYRALLRGDRHLLEKSDIIEFDAGATPLALSTAACSSGW